MIFVIFMILMIFWNSNTKKFNAVYVNISKLKWLSIQLQRIKKLEFDKKHYFKFLFAYTLSWKSWKTLGKSSNPSQNTDFLILTKFWFFEYFHQIFFAYVFLSHYLTGCPLRIPSAQVYQYFKFSFSQKNRCSQNPTFEKWDSGNIDFLD